MDQLPRSKDDSGPCQDEPFHPKRRQRISRMGCQNCKARKVKCDKSRPFCQTCILRKEQCVYAMPFRHKPSPKALWAAKRRSRLRAASDKSHGLVPVTVVNEPVAVLPGCDQIDMKMIWHFMAITCSSFSIDGGGSQNVMRVQVMKHALDVRFLFRSVLALSCLHATNCTGEDVGDPSRHLLYQNESLHEYRQAIEAAEPRTFGALIANSLLITATSAQTFRDPHAPDLYILQWLLVWRGIRAIFQQIKRTALSSTGLAQLFHRPSMNLKEAAKHIPRNLISLIMSIPPQDPEILCQNAYLQGLKYLGSLYQNLREGGLGPVMRLRIITWFTFVPSRLVELFRERRERALIILAHYAVFLKLTAGVWWLVGVGNRSLRDICKHLGPAWHFALDVPLRAMSIEDTTELARLVLGDPFWDPRRSPVGTEDAAQERETKQLGLVDDEGRPIRLLEDAGTIELAEPSEPGEEPVWHVDK